MGKTIPWYTVLKISGVDLRLATFQWLEKVTCIQPVPKWSLISWQQVKKHITKRTCTCSFFHPPEKNTGILIIPDKHNPFHQHLPKRPSTSYTLEYLDCMVIKVSSAAFDENLKGSYINIGRSYIWRVLWMLVNKIKTTGCLKIMSVHLSQEKTISLSLSFMMFH